MGKKKAGNGGDADERHGRERVVKYTFFLYSSSSTTKQLLSLHVNLGRHNVHPTIQTILSVIIGIIIIIVQFLNVGTLRRKRATNNFRHYLFASKVFHTFPLPLPLLPFLSPQCVVPQHLYLLSPGDRDQILSSFSPTPPHPNWIPRVLARLSPFILPIPNVSWLALLRSVLEGSRGVDMLANRCQIVNG